MAREENRYASDLAPEEIFNEAELVLARDQRKASGLSYPVYKGQTIAPMSSLTQRARTLKEGFAKKPAPYTGKLESVLNRPNTGASPQNIQDQLRMLGRRQQNFSEDQMLGALRNQFRESYNPRVDRFRRKGEKDLRRGQAEAESSFGDIGRASGTLEQSSNEQLVRTLKGLQAQKEARRKGLTGTLEEFGSQKHGHTNLVNKAAQNQFNQEANAPFTRMQMLRESLGPLQGNTALEVHPDIQDQAGRDALQGLRAYGVDTSGPVNEWAGKDRPSYLGQLVADLTPEIKASHSTLEGMNPKYKDTLYGKRKGLTRQLMGNESVGGQAMAAVPERMRGAVGALESEAKQKLKKDLAAISHQYVQANQYGSPQHIKAAEDRAREVSKATFGERNKLLQGSMKSELSLGHQGQIDNLRQLGLYGEHGQKEFSDVLGTVRDMNKLGSTKWGNEQAENEDLYKDYQNQAGWEWPHMKGAIAGEARRGALGDVFSGMQDRNISLDQLANLNTNYSELQKENAARVSDLDTRDKTISDLQKQLGVFNKQQERARVQQANDRERAEEAQRLQRLKGESGVYLNHWNQLMARKAEADRYYAPIPGHSRGVSMAHRDQLRSYPGSNFSAHILGHVEFRDQKTALAKEASKAGINPGTAFPGYWNLE